MYTLYLSLQIYYVWFIVWKQSVAVIRNNTLLYISLFAIKRILLFFSLLNVYNVRNMYHKSGFDSQSISTFVFHMHKTGKSLITQIWSAEGKKLLDRFFCQFCINISHTQPNIRKAILLESNFHGIRMSRFRFD